MPTRDELEKFLKSFDWKEAFYDPLHDSVEADNPDQRDDLTRMELLIDGLQRTFNSGEVGQKRVAELTNRYWLGNPMEEQIPDLFANKNNVMNENNLKFLKDNGKYMGFGEGLAPSLEKEIMKGSPGFTLAFQTEINKQNAEATLHFRKSDTSDMYFFNKYDVRIQKEKEGPAVAQTFYINKGQGVTLKEAYNLLEGRSVYKELTDKQDQKYNAWVQLDFGSKDKNGNFERKQFHQNYGYDVKEAVSYFPIKELNVDADRQKFIRSLEKGNVQSATMATSGSDVKFFIEANPQFKTVNIYNEKMKPLNHETKQALMEKPDIRVGTELKQNKELASTTDIPLQTAPKKQKGKADQHLKTAGQVLLPKKRLNSSKGLSH